MAKVINKYLNLFAFFTHTLLKLVLIRHLNLQTFRPIKQVGKVCETHYSVNLPSL